MKKTTLIKAASLTTSILPPLTTLLVKFQVFTETTEKSLSTAALCVIILMFGVFKDFLKKYFEIPSAFKIALVFFVIGSIAVNLGQELLLLGTVALISSGCSIPLDIWYNSLIKENTTNEGLETLKTLLKEVSNGEEKSDKNS